MNCPTYEVPFGSQLKQGGSTGPYDCTAWAASRAIGHATCGATVPSGRTVRLMSNEPIPDPNSPGLNLPQVQAVAADFGVFLDVHVGYRKVTFAEYERRRKAGQGCIIQVSYGPIADSKYDAGRGFRGGHAIFESLHATVDSLADGRAAGVFRYDGTVYTRSVMENAAGSLVIGSAGPGPIRVGQGFVWAAFTRDVVPSYRASVPNGSYWAYQVSNGVVVLRALRTTGGFSSESTPPKTYRWGARSVTLVRLLSGSHAGRYISANYAKEV